ncbi:hypothetical protein QTP88_006178 [Uroleucon formosanum]
MDVDDDDIRYELLRTLQPVRSIQLNRHAFANGVIRVQKGLYVHEPASQMYPLSEEDSMTSPDTAYNIILSMGCRVCMHVPVLLLRVENMLLILN